jgi:hypothetical protein
MIKIFFFGEAMTIAGLCCVRPGVTNVGWEEL